MHPCGARRSQSLLPGVELERRPGPARRLPRAVGPGCGRSRCGERSPAPAAFPGSIAGAEQRGRPRRLSPARRTEVPTGRSAPRRV